MRKQDIQYVSDEVCFKCGYSVHDHKINEEDLSNWTIDDHEFYSYADEYQRQLEAGELEQ